MFLKNLQRTVIGRYRYVLGQLLSANVVSDAYHCPRTHFNEVLLYLPAKVIGL